MRVLPLIVALSLVSAAAEAQAKANTRQGFWIGFGFGPGSTGVDCTSCDDARVNGFTGYLRMGGTLSHKWLLGGESSAWVRSANGTDEDMEFASLVAMWYPSETGAFYLKFGIGGMTFASKDSISGDELTATAGSFTVGVGYEFRVGRNFSVVPFLNSMASAPASFKLNGQPASTSEDLSLNMVQIGVGVTWH